MLLGGEPGRTLVQLKPTNSRKGNRGAHDTEKFSDLMVTPGTQPVLGAALPHAGRSRSSWPFAFPGLSSSLNGLNQLRGLLWLDMMPLPRPIAAAGPGVRPSERPGPGAHCQ